MTNKYNTNTFLENQLIKLSELTKGVEVADGAFLFIISDVKYILDYILSAYSVEEVLDCLKTSFINDTATYNKMLEVLFSLRIIDAKEYASVI